MGLRAVDLGGQAHNRPVLLVKFTPLQLPIWMLVLSIVIAAVSANDEPPGCVTDRQSGVPRPVSPFKLR